MRRYLFMMLFIPLVANSQSVFYRHYITADTIAAGAVLGYLDSTKVVPFDSLGLALADSSVHMIVVHRGRLYVGVKPTGGSPDSSVFATKFFTNSTYAPLAHSHAGSYVGVGDTSGMMRRSDSTWFMTKEYANDYLPVTGGTLTGSLDVTGSSIATTFMRAATDTIGTSGVSGERTTSWTNTNCRYTLGESSTGVLSFKRYTYYDAAIKTFMQLTKLGTSVSWLGQHSVDTLLVPYYATITGALTAGSLITGGDLSVTGIPRQGSDTLATKAYARSVGGGGGGVADGQNADSLQGKILDTLGRDLGGSKLTVPAYLPDSTKYKHVRLAKLDSAGQGAAGNNAVFGPSVTGDSVKIKAALLLSDTLGVLVTTQAEMDAATNLLAPKDSPTFTGTATFSSTQRGTASFTTTGTRLAVYVPGATSSSIFITSTKSTSAATAVDTRQGLTAKTDSLIVVRPASGTSGQSIYWWHVK